MVITQDGDTVDAVCWRVYGQTIGLVEQVYELNPGLSKLPVILPAGVTIRLPKNMSQNQKKERVKLW